LPGWGGNWGNRGRLGGTGNRDSIKSQDHGKLGPRQGRWGTAGGPPHRKEGKSSRADPRGPCLSKRLPFLSHFPGAGVGIDCRLIPGSKPGIRRSMGGKRVRPGGHGRSWDDLTGARRGREGHVARPPWATGPIRRGTLAAGPDRKARKPLRVRSRHVTPWNLLYAWVPRGDGSQTRPARGGGGPLANSFHFGHQPSDFEGRPFSHTCGVDWAGWPQAAPSFDISPATQRARDRARAGRSFFQGWAVLVSKPGTCAPTARPPGSSDKHMGEGGEGGTKGFSCPRTI